MGAVPWDVDEPQRREAVRAARARLRSMLSTEVESLGEQAAETGLAAPIEALVDQLRDPAPPADGG